jgi:hypothetical protein
MSKKLILSVVIAALALSACGAAATPAPSYSDGQAPSGGERGFGLAAAPTSAPAATQAPAAVLPGPGVVNDATVATERLVIKNASLSLVVKDPAAAVDSITAMAEGMNGFVVTSNVYQTSTDSAGNKIMQAQITIRVPAENLQTALNQLKGMAVTVNSENISGEDVTAQYTDLQSQLKNLEAAEQQLQKIMDGATKTEDVLAVYNQLVGIRGQIEQVKGQMKYYSESAAMSLITIDLIPDALSQPLEVGGWKPQGIAKDAIEALIKAFQFLATLGIWGVLFCVPLGLVFGVPAYFVVRLGVRRFRKPRPAAAA